MLRRPKILMYHSITRSIRDPNELCTSPERFEAQMLYLDRRNLRGVSIRELRRAMSAGAAKGLIGITFDDGYKDLLYTALPVLERLGFSATVFAVGGMLGRENDWEHVYEPRPRMKLLGVEELREASGRGIEVGSHSMTHARLSGLEPESLGREVEGSRQVLGELLGTAVEGFCYPYGSLDGVAVRAVRCAGYAYACGVKTQVEGGAHDLPRIPVSERDSLPRFEVKLRMYAQYARITRNFG
jgi:peptidoglycan/xylan/chitin deacetylase (PgdA/CDA1 family)